MEEHARLSTLALQAFLTRDEPFYTYKSTDLESAIQGSNEERLVTLARKLYYEGLFTSRDRIVPESVRKEARKLVGEPEKEKPIAQGDGKPADDGGSGAGPQGSAPGSDSGSVAGPSADIASLQGDDLQEQINTRQRRLGSSMVAPHERDTTALELLILEYKMLLETGRIAEAQAKLRELMKAYASLCAKLAQENNARLAARVRGAVGDWMLSLGNYSDARNVFSGGTNDGTGNDSSDSTDGADSTIDALVGRSAARDGLGDGAGAEQDLDRALALAEKTGSPRLPYLKMMREQRIPGRGTNVHTTQASSRGSSTPAPDPVAERLALLRAKLRSAAELQRECSSLEDALKLRLEIVGDLRTIGRAESDRELVEAQRDLAALLRVRGRLEEARAIEASVDSAVARVK